MKTYWCGDPHFGHNNILKHCARVQFMTPEDRAQFEAIDGDLERYKAFRPSDESTRRMDEALIENINARVGADDHLICVGDWALGPREDDGLDHYLGRCTAIRERIACKAITLILGNHDRPEISGVFGPPPITESTFLDFHEGCPPVFLTHRPPEAYPNPRDLPYPMPRIWLHGHTHERPAKPRVSPVRHTVALDIGFDGNDYRVYSTPELLARLQLTLEMAPDHGWRYLEQAE